MTGDVRVGGWIGLRDVRRGGRPEWDALLYRAIAVAIAIAVAVAIAIAIRAGASDRDRVVLWSCPLAGRGADGCQRVAGLVYGVGGRVETVVCKGQQVGLAVGVSVRVWMV